MNPAPPDALIFDLDGVLIDSHAAVTGSISATLADHGLPRRPEAELRRFIGPPTFSAFSELAGPGAGRERIAALVADYRSRYAEVYLAQTTAIEGIVPALEALAARVPLAIATSKSVTFTAPLLEALDLARWFEVVEAAAPDDSDDDKTAIVGRALRALSRLGRRRPAMVGDRSFDIEAARAHGLLAVGVTWGIGSVAELEAAGADLLVGAPGDLPALLGAAGPQSG